jgi:hypothetical protein
MVRSEDMLSIGLWHVGVRRVGGEWASTLISSSR